MKLAIKAQVTACPSVAAAVVREALRAGPKPAVVTVEDVQGAVCEHYRLELPQLIGKDRHREVAVARQVAMYLARTHLSTSFPQIGAKFDGKDHTTVMSAVRRVEKLLGEDAEVAAAVDVLSLKLGFQPRPALSRPSAREKTRCGQLRPASFPMLSTGCVASLGSFESCVVTIAYGACRRLHRP